MEDSSEKQIEISLNNLMKIEKLGKLDNNELDYISKILPSYFYPKLNIITRAIIASAMGYYLLKVENNKIILDKLFILLARHIYHESISEKQQNDSNSDT